MQQLIQIRTGSSSSNSKIAASEDSEALVDLGDENEDDYFGIFLFLKHL